MTVTSLEVAKELVQEIGNAVAVYEYLHATTHKKLWSVEIPVSEGSTIRSEYVMYPRLIYTPEGGWTE